MQKFKRRRTVELSELIIYILKVIGLHGVLFLLYHFGIRQRVDHQSLRFYLILTLVIAFLIPFVPINNFGEKPVISIEEIGAYFLEEDPNVVPFEAAETGILTPSKGLKGLDTLPIIYLIITFLLVGKFMLNLILLYFLKFRSELINRNPCNLYKTSKTSSFSFFSNVFIPEELFGTRSFRFILTHEYEHARRYHSIDRVLMDFLATLFWFNPFIYFYRNALIEIHEYQADDAVLRKYDDPIGYQEVLYAQLEPATHSGLMSHFNFSTIKKRIVMINSNEKVKSRKALLLALPVLVIAIFGFAKAPDKHQVVMENLVEPKIAEEVPVMQDLTPSILPLRNASSMRVSSSFGMRPDPFDGKTKMHRGLDIKVPEGTSVIATADGIVHSATENIGGYGNFILIKHGDEYMTRYAQLFSLGVKEGDVVKKGQELGKSGSSGRSTGPHLHYEVVEIGVGHQDPLKFIKDHDFRSIP